jgi:hypothetical protein
MTKMSQPKGALLGAVEQKRMEAIEELLFQQV